MVSCFFGLEVGGMAGVGRVGQLRKRVGGKGVELYFS